MRTTGMRIGLGCWFVLSMAFATLGDDVSTSAPGADPAGTLVELWDVGSIGGGQDSSPIAVSTRLLLDTNIPPTLPDRNLRALAALDALQISFMNAFPAPGRNELENRLANALTEASRELVGAKAADTYAHPGNWKLSKNKLRITIAPICVLDFNATYLTGACATSDSPECQHAFSRAVIALRHAELARRILDYDRRDAALSAVGAVADKRVAQWEQYLDHGFPQWPWELFSNGGIYRSQTKGKRGLEPPPAWQLIWAHPDLAMEYVNGAADGNQFEPSLLIEVIGVDAWTWKDDGPRQKGPFGFPIPLGAGVVASYSDRAGTDDWGWGGVLHVDHVYSAGVTSHGGDTGYFVSANVSKLMEQALDKKRQWFGGN